MPALGIIGCGNRACWLIKMFEGFEADIYITAIHDTISEEEIRKRLDSFNIDHSRMKYYESVEDFFEAKSYDGIMISTRCSSHARYAASAFKLGLPIYLEKPVATTYDDLRLLKDAASKYNPDVLVSFPLRHTPHVQEIKKIVTSGELGLVAHAVASNFVPYGSVYFQSWYRDYNETGGLFLQKATHDLDYINYILDQKPTQVCAMTSKNVFTGNKPAGLNCKECPEYEICPQSPYYIKHFSFDGVQGELCAFAQDAGNEDSGSAIIRYESGLHVSYSQNFFIKKSAARRGAAFFGQHGTAEFDLFTNKVTINFHNKPQSRVYDIGDSGGHGGGDNVLIYNFINMLRGREKSTTPLECGVLSALMCLKARDSSQSMQFEKINSDDI